jgi:uncharacterized protein (TIGR02246 family)
MKRFAAICTAAAIALIVTACSQTPDTHDADVKAIQDSEAQWNQDYAAKDVGKIMAHYSDDAILMAPGMPASSGRDAIRTMIQQMAADPALSLRFHAGKVEVAKSGDVGYTQGIYTMVMTDPQTKQLVHDHGSYVTTYRKQPDGAWKAVADIASSEVPPPAPPPPPRKKGPGPPPQKGHKKSH